MSKINKCDTIMKLQDIFTEEINEHKIKDDKITIIPINLKNIHSTCNLNEKYTKTQIEQLKFANETLKEEYNKYKFLIFITGKRGKYKPIIQQIDTIINDNKDL